MHLKNSMTLMFSFEKLPRELKQLESCQACKFVTYKVSYYLHEKVFAGERRSPHITGNFLWLQQPTSTTCTVRCIYHQVS